jgi:ribulose-phosphate 3-epimerase
MTAQHYELKPDSKKPAGGRPLVAPSVLTADFCRLKEELVSLEEGGADLVHLDIMDGQFVPRISFGDPISSAIKNCSKLFIESHLMTLTPSILVEGLIAAGTQRILIHQEATVHLHRDLEFIKQKGCQAGVALNPATPVETIKQILHLCDVVLIMTVNPGWGGRPFIEEMIPKIREARGLIDADPNCNALIEVDGGINAATARKCVLAGASILVAGSYILGAPNRAAAIESLQSL